MVKLIWRLSDNFIYHVFSMETSDDLLTNFTIKSNTVHIVSIESSY